MKLQDLTEIEKNINYVEDMTYNIWNFKGHGELLKDIKIQADARNWHFGRND